MPISVDAIRALRDATGAGIMDSKKALESADGDMKEAEEILRQQESPPRQRRPTGPPTRGSSSRTSTAAGASEP